MDHTLAIDFGTSNSSVYLLKQKEEMLPDENGNYLFPSYIEYTQRVVAVGSVARRNLGRTGHFVVACVKRLLGLTYEEYEKIEEKGLFGCEVVRGDDGYPRLVVSKDGKQVTCEEAASELFRAMKKRADTFNSPCVYDQCYLTVPANYKDAQCRAITRAAELAVRCEPLEAENESLRASARECAHLKEHIADIEINAHRRTEEFRAEAIEKLRAIIGQQRTWCQKQRGAYAFMSETILQDIRRAEDVLENADYSGFDQMMADLQQLEDTID